MSLSEGEKGGEEPGAFVEDGVCVEMVLALHLRNHVALSLLSESQSGCLIL